MFYGITQCEDQLKVFNHLTSVLKDAVQKSGGSLSHHHGIGKKNAASYGIIMSNVSIQMFKSLKALIDPKNIFAAGNFSLESEHVSKLSSKL
jgi:alkyldihydroxyacetonephosphate synthase